jgi:hypothetical protein
MKQAGRRDGEGQRTGRALCESFGARCGLLRPAVSFERSVFLRTKGEAGCMGNADGPAPQATRHGRLRTSIYRPAPPACSTGLLHPFAATPPECFRRRLRRRPPETFLLPVPPPPSATYFFGNLPGALLPVTRPCLECVTQGTRCSLYLCQSDRRYSRAPVVEAGAPFGADKRQHLCFRMSRRPATPGATGRFVRRKTGAGGGSYPRMDIGEGHLCPPLLAWTVLPLLTEPVSCRRLGAGRRCRPSTLPDGCGDLSGDRSIARLLYTSSLA